MTDDALSGLMFLIGAASVAVAGLMIWGAPGVLLTIGGASLFCAIRRTR